MRTETRASLIQVVPEGQGGVFDYLQCLKAQWDARGLSSHVIALSEKLAAEHSLAKRIDACIGEPGRQACSVVLHFSGYGYAKRGVCFWLLDELQALRAARSHTLKLTVVFHELFAAGPPWSSAFWVSGSQKRIATLLAQMADLAWTNTQRHATWLSGELRSGVRLHQRPVFSNVGEPRSVPPPSGRVARAVVFGLSSTRQRVFDALQGHEATLQRLGIHELVEVGSGGASKWAMFDMPHRHLGRLEQAELSELLLLSRFALVDYPADCLAKSGVFAAYAAHGCVVIDTHPPGPDTDGLVGGRDYFSLQTLIEGVDAGLGAHELELTAARCHRWYDEHRLDLQAAQLWALAAA
ncbi:MAG: hypothetical protein IV105_01625 [Rhizobacter sp.]|nr:hypothetical protein [Rhizobacter sp.]